MKPESQKAPLGNAVKVCAFWGGFLSFCCLLACEETPWQFLHQKAPLSIAVVLSDAVVFANRSSSWETPGSLLL